MQYISGPQFCNLTTCHSETSVLGYHLKCVALFSEAFGHNIVVALGMDFSVNDQYNNILQAVIPSINYGIKVVLTIKFFALCYLNMIYMY